MYRFLEEYIYSDKLENLPHLSGSQRFTKKKGYEGHFLAMLEAAQHIPIWLFSYNDSSWNGIEHITDLIKQFRKNVTTEVLSDEYRYLYRKCQGRGKGRSSKEYLIIAR